VKSSSGFTLFEFLVVVVLISLLGAVLLDRLALYQEQAEKAAMQQMISDLRSTLRMKIADRLLNGRQGQTKLVDENPMDWLIGKPSNYVGERFGPAPGSMPGGLWYFDLRDKTLIYVVAGRHFVADPAGRKEVRFQVRPASSIKPQASQDIADKQNIDSVILALVEPYRWF
jgi:prepilin-type N-terminal cleavage/methylation domain-containing protein